MTIIETIVRGVQNLPLREQVEVARFVHRLSAGAQQSVPKCSDAPTELSTKATAKPLSRR